MAKYNVRYKELQTGAALMKNIGKTLASYESRLNSIASAMDSRDSNMASLKSQVKSAAAKVPAVANRVSAGGAAANEISNTYLTAEKTTHGAISGVATAAGLPSWFTGSIGAGIIAAEGFASQVGAVITPGSGASAGGLGKFELPQPYNTMFELLKTGNKWGGGVVKGTGKAIEYLAKEMPDVDLGIFKNFTPVVDGFKQFGTVMTVASAGFSIFGSAYDSLLRGDSTSRVIGNITAETTYQVAKFAAKKAVCGTAATEGAALGAAIGTFIFPGAGTVIGGVVGGAVGYIASSYVMDKAFEWYDKTFHVKENISNLVTATADVVSNTAKAVGGAIKETGKAVGKLINSIKPPKIKFSF